MTPALTGLVRQLGYEFRDPALLQRALTHRSHASLHNERLEFLGDSVLNCVAAMLLYEHFPSLPEGDLSRLRAGLVRKETLHEIAQDFALGSFIRLGEGELKSGGHRRPSILADALEAILGAVLLDGGFDAARDLIARIYAPRLGALDPRAAKDAKTRLQEALQARHIPLPRYTLEAVEGAAHAQSFRVRCDIPELGVATSGSGGSRRAAEQDAAHQAYAAIQEPPQ